jgi:acyl carrier protein
LRRGNHRPVKYRLCGVQFHRRLKLMTKDEIASVLRELSREQRKQIKVDVNAITPESRFDHLGFDSLSILDFMYAVEERFGVIPETAEMVKMQRVGELIDYLHSNMQS